MIKTNIFVLIILTLICSCVGIGSGIGYMMNAGILKGKVCDENQQPIANAKLLIFKQFRTEDCCEYNSIRDSVYSDQYGNFELLLSGSLIFDNKFSNLENKIFVDSILVTISKSGFGNIDNYKDIKLQYISFYDFYNMKDYKDIVANDLGINLLTTKQK